MRYKMINELKAQTKVFKFIYLFDVIFLVIWVAAGLMIKNTVYTDLQTAFLIVHIIFGLVLRASSPYNKQKRIFQGISFFITKDRNVYKPIKLDRKDFPQIKRHNLMYGDYEDKLQEKT